LALTFLRFQLENHIVHLDQDVKAPAYIEEQPYIDLSSLERKEDSNTLALGDTDTDPLVNVDILRQFPKNVDSGMDNSQLAACENMLTARVAIVQGPPGTGKTFTSVSTLKVMIENLGPEDPPIIVAAQTNHALDQLLNHILTFQPNIVRLGGRCDKANTAIMNRTLYELRLGNGNFPDGKKGLRLAYMDYQKRVGEVKSALETLTTESLLNAETLFKHRLITEVQLKSLCRVSSWEGEDDSNGDMAECKIPPEPFGV
jgi:helicase required for RNAi-mediated heterochromatin assembly 1